MKALGALSLALLLACPRGGCAGDLSPFYGKFFLVAGSGEAAFKDGNFIKAAFRRPCGLAASPDWKTLYVVDRGNHALRAIDLPHQNRVRTLCGNGEAGKVDGIGTAARLSFPSQVLAVPEASCLYLLDQDGHALRRLDLRSRRLRTLMPARPGLVYSQLSYDAFTAALYALSGESLYTLDEASSKLKLVGRDAAFSCPQGRLFFLEGDGTQGDFSPSIGYYFSPCAGQVYRLKLPTARNLADLSWSRRAKAAMQVIPVYDSALSPTATGFYGNPTNVYFWDPSHGGPAVFDPVARIHYSSLSDYQGRPLAGGEGPQAAQRRTLFAGPLALLPGPSGMLYVADSRSSRVLGLDMNLMVDNNTEARLMRMGEAKPAGVDRILVVGTSMTYDWLPSGPQDPYDVHLSFVRQLESYLNLESALQGKGGHYEVLSLSKPLGAMSGGPDTFFLQHGAEYRAHQVDEALLALDYMGLCKELEAFAVGLTQDDMALVDPQPALWQNMTSQERYQALGPLSRAFVDYVRAHPDQCKGSVEFDERGWVAFRKKDRDLLEFPPFRDFALALLAKTLKRCRDFAKQEGFKLAVVLYPTRDLVEVGEQGGDDYYDHINGAVLDAPLQGICARLGLRCYALTDEARLLAPDFYPWVQLGDHHLSSRSQGWLAFLLARKMTQNHAEIGSE